MYVPPRKCNWEPRADRRTNPVAFKVYDMDRDGFISNGELFLVLKMMVGSNLKVRHRPHRDTVTTLGLTIRLVGRAIATDRGQDDYGSR